MYYCIRCKRPHEASNEHVIFRTGFYQAASDRMNVGYCPSAASSPRSEIPLHVQHEKIRWTNRSKQRLLKI